MTKPRARYQGVTEEDATGSALPSSPNATEGEASKKSARSIKRKESHQSRLAGRSLRNTEGIRKQALC